MRDLTEIAEPPELTDGRLRLRALRPEDKPAVVAALNDPECGKYLWRPPFPYKDADFDEFFAGRAVAWKDARDAFWTVADAADDSVLAAISLDVNEELQAGEIGYWCGPWARRRGVMAAALRLVRDWAFDGLGLERLEITADADNVASQRVAQSAGFRREGVRRSFLPVHGRRTDDVMLAIVPRRSPARRGRPPAGGAGLAPAERRTAGRPAVRAERRPGRPGRLRRPGRRALDPWAAGAVQPRRRRVVHRRRPAPPGGRRARPARRHGGRLG